jgi:hypothetical protein
MNSNNPIVRQFKRNNNYQLLAPISTFDENRKKTNKELLNKLVQKVRNAHQFRSSFRSCNSYYSKATEKEVENIDEKIKKLIEPPLYYDPENTADI